MTKARRLTTKFIAYTAVMTALTYVGTLIGFSSAQFYFNLGDSVILITAALLGPFSAMIAGGLGSFLGDLTVYPATMVYTLVIKAIEGLAAGLLFMLVNRLTRSYSTRLLSALIPDNAPTTIDENSPQLSKSQPVTSQRSPSEDSYPEFDLAHGSTSPSSLDNYPTAIDKNSPRSTQSEFASHSASNADSSHPIHPADSPTTIDENSPQFSQSEFASLPASNADSSYPIHPADSPTTTDENSTQFSKSELNIAQNGTLTADSVNRSQKRKVARKTVLLTSILSLPTCAVSSGLMVAGYFIAQTFMYGTRAAALVALPMDAVQATLSSVIATAVITISSLSRHLFPRH